MARIAIEGFAIGEREFEALRHGVEVIGTVVSRRLKRPGIHDVERLAQHRPLAPGAASVHLGSGEAHRGRVLDRRVEVGEILGRQPSAFLAMECHHRLGDVAAIESVTSRLETGHPIAAPGSG